MKIGIDASRANREYKTGTEWYSYYLLRSLARIDKKNEYILYTDKPLTEGLINLSSDNPQVLKEEKVKFDKKGFQILKSPHNNFKAKVLKWPFSFFWTLGRLSLEMIFKKPDILFVPAHSLPLFFPKKTVNTIHDIAFKKEQKLYQKQIFPYKGKKFRVYLNCLIRTVTLGRLSCNSVDYLDWSTKFALKKAKKVITVSNFTKKELLRTYKKAKEDKIQVIYNGYNTEIYHPIENKTQIEEVLNKYGLEPPYFLYVGRLEKKKNTARLIEALAILKENYPNDKSNLVLIGNASFGYGELKYVISEFSLESNIIMPGWVEEEDLPYIFNGARAFIFPSKHEGFGIPVIQALACNIPTAASNIEVIKEIAEESVLYFNPYDKHSIAFAMHKISSDDNLRGELIKKGQERAKDFNWHKCAQETLDLLENI